MTHSVESLMALADAYAQATADVREYLGANAGMDENELCWRLMVASKAELRAALTEALQAAQPVAHPDYTLLRQALEALLPHKSNALRWYTPVDAAIDALRARLESV